MEYKRLRHSQTITCNVAVKFQALLKSFRERAPFSSGRLLVLLVLIRPSNITGTILDSTVSFSNINIYETHTHHTTCELSYNKALLI